jgi:uncharacterized protein
MAYRILSLDGGGSWALIQARVLKDLYPGMRGHELLRNFELAIANSGGSLVLACLCNDMKLDEIVDVFENEDNRKQVFSKLTFNEKLKAHDLLSLIRKLIHIGPKYKATRKIEGLRRVLTSYDHLYNQKIISRPIIDTYLDELPEIIKKPELNILIVGYDYFQERVSFFRSNLTSLTDGFSPGKKIRISLGGAIHSSSNAPINYFDEPATVNVEGVLKQDQRTTWYWDGAVAGFNNPVLAGLIEAITNNPQLPLDEFKVLSIGTGLTQRAVITDYNSSTDRELREIYEKNKNNPYVISDNSFKFLHDIKKMSGSILSDPPDSATFIAYSILHRDFKVDNPNLVRINPCVTTSLKDSIYSVPDVYINRPDIFNKLLDLDMDAVETPDLELITDLCVKFITDQNPAIPNQFIRGDAKNKHIGYGSYREAKERWKLIA